MTNLQAQMDPLRKIVVQLNFVNRPSSEVVARSITYAGFVGVLTGVRKDLSISLNFRPCHNNSASGVSNVRYAFHQLMVLLGFRASISAVLRSYLLDGTKRTSKNPDPSDENHSDGKLWTMEQIQKDFPKARTGASYVIVSDGRKTMVFEKDRMTAVMLASSSFIVATNHDNAEDRDCSKETEESKHLHGRGGVAELSTLVDELADDSVIRKGCVKEKWQATLKKAKSSSPKSVSIGEDEIVRWTRAWPTSNECTHYAAVLDPAKGTIFWSRRWLRPIKPREETQP